MEFRYYQKEAIECMFDCSVPNVVVLPTGAGKSLVIAGAVRKFLSEAPQYNVMILQHRKELIEQNYDKFIKIAPEFLLNTGIYSASLKCKEIKQITFAGIQSIHDKEFWGTVHALFIDEADLIPPEDDSMYRGFIERLRKRNRNMGIFGLTATPFRLKTGLICEGENTIFKEISYDVSIKELIRQGYLSGLNTKFGREQADLQKVRARQGEYVLSDLEKAVNPIVQAICDEVVSYKNERKHWLIFCSGVEQAKQFAAELTAKGSLTYAVHGDLSMRERDDLLQGFREGKWHLSNCDILTVGVDLPMVDLIAVARPTKSARLFIQMVGRGLRLYPDKKDCLVLDYGRNIEKFGAIDQIKVKKVRGNYAMVIAPLKKCPQCGNTLSIQIMKCQCGYIFERQAKNPEPEASELPILSEERWFDVRDVSYKVHRKEGKPPSLKITYHLDNDFANIFLCFQHGGYAQKKAYLNWRKFSRGVGSIPLETELAFHRVNELATPCRVLLQKTGSSFWEVLDYDFSAPVKQALPEDDFIDGVEMPNV